MIEWRTETKRLFIVNCMTVDGEEFTLRRNAVDEREAVARVAANLLADGRGDIAVSAKPLVEYYDPYLLT